MATITPSTTDTPAGLEQITVRRATIGGTFLALLLRDLTVLRKNLKEFIPRTLIQPLLLVFVFTYVFPKIGQGIGSAVPVAGLTGAAARLAAQKAADFATLLVAGVLGTSIVFQGIQSTALPLVQEFGYTREIEDRVLAPLPIELVAIEKIVAGAIQCLIAGLIVFPIARFVPANTPQLHIHWWVLLTMVPLACLTAAAMGLTFGTIFNPRTVPMLFGVIVIPMTFLGCVYFAWSALGKIAWLKWAVLINPLVYICEGFRAALTTSDHMSLAVVYPVLLVLVGAFTSISIRFFKRRVIA
jgi:ABC-2 type transport system permease protein